MLTLTLRGLERDGLVDRVVSNAVPPQLAHALTALGQSFHQAVQPVLDWVQQHEAAMARAR